MNSGSGNAGSGNSGSAGSNAARSLFQLSKCDVEIQVLKGRIQDQEQLLRNAQQGISTRAAELSQLDVQCTGASARQSEEEERLRAEQRKIVERRKHLSTIGGTRGAKLMEREIDISSRTVQQMEQKVLQMLEETDQLKTKAASLRNELDTLQLEFEASASAAQTSLEELRSRMHGLEQRRDSDIAELDERVRGLYLRVSSRYPGSAVAVAEAGSCRSCFRALPAQTFNQVRSGNNLLQCPGCSRILIAASSIADDAGNGSESGGVA